VFHAELAASRLPILLGGDHSLAIGSISAAARHCREAGRQLRVLWFDAHADANTHVLTPSGNIHGMPMAVLCGYGPAGLVGIGGAAPAIAPGVVRQIGIRSVDAGEKRFVHELRLEVFDMRYIDEMGMRQTMQAALAGLDRNTHLHVSFDVDFLDPEIAPGVGTTVAGGPSYRESQLCMEMVADTGLLGSVDIMELNPAYDLHNRTAEVRQEHPHAARGRLVFRNKVLEQIQTRFRPGPDRLRPGLWRGPKPRLTPQRRGIYNRGPFRPPPRYTGSG
jgi:arginase